MRVASLGPVDFAWQISRDTAGCFDIAHRRMMSERMTGLPHRQNFKPHIHVTAADFEGITRSGALCNSQGNLDAAGFENMMRMEVPAHTSSAHFGICLVLFLPGMSEVLLNVGNRGCAGTSLFTYFVIFLRNTETYCV